MADMGLLGLDPDMQQQLQAFLASAQPSEEDKKRAVTQSLLSFGLNTLANSDLPPGMAAGRGGAAGLGAYNDELKQLQAQRQQNLPSYTSLLPILMQQKQFKAGMGMINDAYAQPQQGAVPAQAPAAATGSSPSTGGLLGPTNQEAKATR